MSAQRVATWYRWDDMPREALHEKLSRRLITGDQLMLAHVYLKKGCVVPKHFHMNEQLTYILEGALRFFVGDDGAQQIDVRAGEGPVTLLLKGGGPFAVRRIRLQASTFDPDSGLSR